MFLPQFLRNTAAVVVVIGELAGPSRAQEAGEFSHKGAEPSRSKVSAKPQDPLPVKALDLTEANYQALRAYILPRPEELRWQQIPWRATWAEAVAVARKENRPIYIWAMNGHPLGNC